MSNGDDGARKRRDWKLAESVSDVGLEGPSTLMLRLNVDVVVHRRKPDPVPASYLTTTITYCRAPRAPRPSHILHSKIRKHRLEVRIRALTPALCACEARNRHHPCSTSQRQQYDRTLIPLPSQSIPDWLAHRFNPSSFIITFFNVSLPCLSP
jgi:hypothetical protein